ncbi:hypothetical protein H310_12866 [Aphanomyces invadans]|uniref:Secreted protein n=1 Tax=Aphanomyces invadans TaxID=157072 RepID=A0A024TG94_9STRA|nr:hypothetical protein H310_12866 [Aphanomyces invadans]ETV93063.1 hypothetical protein H310_12866 [Aphanomyces invadans]|eukprot:XP_008878328.1 hypothetical protein H310_12866 [Aphanomyces invadans]
MRLASLASILCISNVRVTGTTYAARSILRARPDESENGCPDLDLWRRSLNAIPRDANGPRHCLANLNQLNESAATAQSVVADEPDVVVVVAELVLWHITAASLELPPTNETWELHA